MVGIKGKRVKINGKFRNRIKNYLVDNGMVMEIFAENCDITYPVVQSLLSGRRDKFNIFNIDKICCYIGENFLSLYDEIELMEK